MISKTHYELLRKIVNIEGIDETLEALQAIEMAESVDTDRELPTEPRAYTDAEILDMLARDSDATPFHINTPPRKPR